MEKGYMQMSKKDALDIIMEVAAGAIKKNKTNDQIEIQKCALGVVSEMRKNMDWIF